MCNPNTRLFSCKFYASEGLLNIGIFRHLYVESGTPFAMWLQQVTINLRWHMEKERYQLRIVVLSTDNYQSYLPSTIHPVCNSSVNKEVFVMQVQVATNKAIWQASKLDYALVGKGETN